MAHKSRRTVGGVRLVWRLVLEWGGIAASLSRFWGSGGATPSTRCLRAGTPRWSPLGAALHTKQGEEPVRGPGVALRVRVCHGLGDDRVKRFSVLFPRTPLVLIHTRSLTYPPDLSSHLSQYPYPSVPVSILVTPRTILGSLQVPRGVWRTGLSSVRRRAGGVARFGRGHGSPIVGCRLAGIRVFR